MRTTPPAVTRLSRRHVLGGICAAALSAAGSAQGISIAQAAWPGEAFVTRAGNDLIAAAKNGSVGAFTRLLNKYVDMNKVARFALGRYRSSFPEANWGEYTELLTKFMAQTMFNYRDKFKGEKFQVMGSRQTNTGLLIRTKLKFIGGRNAQPVDWKVVGSSGNFRVFDINFQQVWLAVLLRDTFTTQIQQGGSPSAVMTYLRNAVRSGTGATVE